MRKSSMFMCVITLYVAGLLTWLFAGGAMRMINRITDTSAGGSNNPFMVIPILAFVGVGLVIVLNYLVDGYIQENETERRKRNS